MKQEAPKKATNAKPIPRIPLPFKEVSGRAQGEAAGERQANSKTKKEA